MKGREAPERRIAIFDGSARIGEVLGGFSQIQLRPEDFSSPLALQMAFTRIYEAVMRAMETGFRKRYVAEVRFKDSMGNPVVVAVDLGEAPPPFSKREVKARVTIELYEEEQD